MAESIFKVGDTVRRKAQPAVVGVVRDPGYPEEATGEWIYRVQFGTATRGVAESELEELPAYSDAWQDLRENVFGSAGDFQGLMTFERLRRPPSPIAASFGSAKAAFYPYQFKPLLKFLESPRQRLLIADDVGLGKTIEAGYILRELKSQAILDRVLLVVPSRLRTKWKHEMERRFGENFEIVAGSAFSKLQKRMEARGHVDRFSWIVSIESARRASVVKFLSESQPPIDLVVVDEAHRMRNPSADQHRLGKALSACADAMVLLTATPVQTSLDNLFRLLNILDPSEFSNSEIFSSQCAANRKVIRAATAMRSNPPAVDVACASLEAMRFNRFTRQITESDYFENLLSRCTNATALDREQLVELQRDINELSLTGNIISRTRKADVMEHRPARQPSTVQFTYSPAERAFYNSVAGLCQLIRPDLSGWGQAMATLQAYRATASCIPAAARTFQEKLDAGKTIIDGLLQEFEEDQEGGSSLSDVWRTRQREILQKHSQISSSIAKLKGHDTKYKFFKDKLDSIWESDGSNGTVLRKVVLFSYFKPTLRYLKERFDEDGIQCRLISGDVSIPRREAIIEEFARDPLIRVLLSSEVGSEGIDLQFASVIVNYDLPWNPMVVEQRIGRLDRIGQASPTIFVLNLVAESTVEQRILLRLYNRIGIFEESVGELDPILGETVDRLAAQAIIGELPAAEQEKRAIESADAMIAQQLQAERLAASADSLMAADQAFLDEIEGIVGRRKIPSETELHRFISEFLASRYSGSRFPKSLAARTANIHTPPEVGAEIARLFPTDPEATRFGRNLEAGPVNATFNQDAALRHANAELVHSRHPLTKWVTRKLENQKDQLVRSFALSLNQSDLQGESREFEGYYAFGIYLFDIGGVRHKVSLVPVFLGEEGDPLESAVADDLLLSLLHAAKSLDPRPQLRTPSIEKLSRGIEQHLKAIREARNLDEQNLNTIRHERLKATLSVALERRVEAAQRRLNELEDRNAAAFAIRMASAKLDKWTRERDQRMESLARIRKPKLETELLAVGVLHIGLNP